MVSSRFCFRKRHDDGDGFSPAGDGDLFSFFNLPQDFRKVDSGFER